MHWLARLRGLVRFRATGRGLHLPRSPCPAPSLRRPRCGAPSGWLSPFDYALVAHRRPSAARTAQAARRWAGNALSFAVRVYPLEGRAPCHAAFNLRHHVEACRPRVGCRRTIPAAGDRVCMGCVGVNRAAYATPARYGTQSQSERRQTGAFVRVDWIGFELDLDFTRGRSGRWRRADRASRCRGWCGGDASRHPSAAERCVRGNHDHRGRRRAAGARARGILARTVHGNRGVEAEAKEAAAPVHMCFSRNSARRGLKLRAFSMKAPSVARICRGPVVTSRSVMYAGDAGANPFLFSS